MRILFCLVLILITLFTKGQSVDESVIYLKNGEIFHGLILKSKDTTQMRLKTRAANERLFDKSQIDTVEVHQVDKAVYQVDSLHHYYQNSGYSLSTYLGMLLGEDDASDLAVGLNTSIINAYRFNAYFTAGIGVASHQFPQDFNYMPLFAHFKSNLLKDNFSPYLSLNLGWNAPWLNDKSDYPFVKKFEGKRFYQMGLGIRNWFSEEVGYTLEVGFASHKMEAQQENSQTWRPINLEEQVRIYTQNRVIFKFGFIF